MNPSPPRLRVIALDCYERPFRLRMPFRFGVITVTHGRQAVVRTRVRLEDGREAAGFAAEALGAKWFDKDPALSDEQNLDQLRRAVEIAADAYLAAGPATAFGLFVGHYRPQLAACAAENLNPLVASFGPALLDRAVLDGVCRALETSFYDAMRADVPGIEPGAVAADLAGFDVARFLAAWPVADTIQARHTVGLVDPITHADQPDGTRVEDGLPETLEEVVATYGHRYYKLKVAGDVAGDVDRLCRIASVLDTLPEYRATLDGNEQYGDVECVLALWSAMEREPRLRRLVASVLFIEQPIRRQTAMSRPIHALAAKRPVIIDESDGDLDAFPRAMALGYAGVSSKTCKGLYKAVLNRARCELHPHTFMSAEDLTTQAGVSVQQDLALVNLLGITHVERNGHHFIDGFDERPAAEADAFLTAHPDLYHCQDRCRVRLRITDGALAIGSLACAGFATAALPRLDALEPMPRAAWPIGRAARPADYDAAPPDRAPA